MRRICVGAAVLVASCGRNEPSLPHRGEVRLAALGPAELALHPGQRRLLRVALVQDGVGPIPDALVRFELTDPERSGSALSAPGATTDPAGIASVEVIGGGSPPAALDVVAVAAAWPEAEAGFAVRLEPLRRMLRVLPRPGTLVASDGESAWVAAPASSAVGLRVREIDADTGEPISGDAVEFALPPMSLVSGFPGAWAHATTNAGGEAQVLLRTGPEVEQFEVSAVSLSGGSPVFFDVAVREPIGSDPPSCGQEAPCPFGFECANGSCQAPGPAACVPSDARSCPSGYECACAADPNGCACRPICPPCAAGEICDTAARICVTAPGLPDVTGLWSTRHAFRLGTLPPGLQAAFASVRILDEMLGGDLGLPSWLERIVRSVMRHFFPAWFRTMIRLADDLGVVLSTLRSEGTMRLERDADGAHLRGTETWTSLVFYWLPLCGNEVGGDPANPPDCARLDVLTADGTRSDGQTCRGERLPSVAVQAAPFTATVEPAGAGRWRLAIPSRQVKIDMGKAVLVTFDVLLAATTGWQCIDEATDCADGKTCAVDCSGLGAWVHDLTRGVVPASGVEGGCAAAVGAAGRTAARLLGELTFTSDALAFGGRASVSRIGEDDSACESQESCAGQLGNDSFDRDLRIDPAVRDGAWEGSFFDPAAHDLLGAWEAGRIGFR